MRITEIIEKKQLGSELSQQEINFFVNGYTKGTVPDYQMSALLMAIYFKGMTDEECANLTLAMANSGDKIDLSKIHGIKVDKHSTGGVGDTTTLVLAPLVAAVGAPVAKMSGRGLGHTGGTLDKLEAIPGFQIEVANDQFIKLVNDNNVAVIGQSGNLAPADKKMYALRDVTCTVNSIPLIASSIMSKKIASGADAIVLDVKAGAGAFMKTLSEARQLANTMVQIGNLVGRKTMAVISNMDEPLGNAIGNALEVKEAIATLRGEGPTDLTKLSLILGSQMVYLSGKAPSIKDAEQKLIKALEDGSAIEKLKVMIRSQGGDETIVDNPDQLQAANYQMEVISQQDGYITEIIANELGHAAMLLGAGRQEKDALIDLAVGLTLHKKVGDQVAQGERLVTIHSNFKNITTVKNKILNNIIISPEKRPQSQLIYEQITN